MHLDEIQDILNIFQDHLEGCQAQNDEIHMWRERFLTENKSIHLKEYFLSIPSKNFLNKRPEELIDQLNDFCKEKIDERHKTKSL